MTASSGLVCRDSQRRSVLRRENQLAPRWNGIDYVEFEPRELTNALRVYFLCETPVDLDRTQFALVSEVLKQTVEVKSFVPCCPRSVRLVTASPLCSMAAYTLGLLRPHDVDPQFASYSFNAAAETTELDPRPKSECAPPKLASPHINYLARDYASIRQTLFDRLALLAPEWRERRVPDLGVTLVELLAYVGDYLSYYQDAVGTEAYLNTARQRISVRRHARLVDYQLHDGCNARTFVQLAVTADVSLRARDVFFITEHPDSLLKSRTALPVEAVEGLPAGAVQGFEIVRWQPRCRRLECCDITNVVGLIGCLLEPPHELAAFLSKCLSQWLVETLRAYARSATKPPPATLVSALAEALAEVFEQHCLWQEVDFSKLLGADSWKKWFAQLGQGNEARCNMGLVKEAMPDFFSRDNDTSIELYPDFNEIQFYTWSRQECCLPVGTTSATLFDGGCEPRGADLQPDPGTDPFASMEGSAEEPSSPRPPASAPDDGLDVAPYYVPPNTCSPYVRAHLDRWNLRRLSPGDILLFEEVRGPKTHNPSDADPAHRQPVRLTKVEFSIDPVTRSRLVEVEWAPEDALPFPLCISSIGPVELGCRLNEKISVARGNVLLVDHGVTIDQPEWLGEVYYDQPPKSCRQPFCSEPPQPTLSRAELFRPALKETDLTYAAPATSNGPAAQLLAVKPHAAAPSIQVVGLPIADEPDDSARDALTPPPTLIDLNDLNVPLGLVMRSRSRSTGEQQRLEASLPPDAARFLQQGRNVGTYAELRRMQNETSHSSVPQGESSQEYQQFKDALRAAVRWDPKAHLLDSLSRDQHFVVENDNDRRARLRFGDDDLGRRPPHDTSFYAFYRRGNGVAGNVGADKIKHVVFRGGLLDSFTSVRNPLPAKGGIEPETLDHARLLAPKQYKKLRRAITADDYAAIVLRDFASQVQQARATLQWMGAWYVVAVAIDPKAEVGDPDALVAVVGRHLEAYRRINHFLEVKLPAYVALEIAMTVCVRAGYLGAHIERELLDRFSNRELPDGSKGFFYPDNFGFGDELYVSRIVTETKKIPGVENVDVTVFQRRGRGNLGELTAGLMKFGPLEIPRLDNDPLRPENGALKLDMRGGR